MDGLASIGGLVGLILVIYIIYRIRLAMAKAANKHIFNRKAAQVGNQLTQTELVIETSATPEAVRNALTAHITQVETRPTGLVSDIYVANQNDSAVMYHYGNRFAVSFQALVLYAPSARGTAVSMQIANWTVDTGVVANADRMQRLRDEVIAAVRAVDEASRAQVVVRTGA